MPLNKPKTYLFALAIALTEALVFAHLAKLTGEILDIDSYSRGVSIGLGALFVSTFFLGQIVVVLGVRIFISQRKWRTIIPLAAATIPTIVLLPLRERAFLFYFAPYWGAMAIGLLLFEGLKSYVESRGKSL